jgi:hypothetical protein
MTQKAFIELSNLLFSPIFRSKSEKFSSSKNFRSRRDQHQISGGEEGDIWKEKKTREIEGNRESERVRKRQKY